MSDELPMHDVVKMVLEAEAESKQVLESAESEVQRITAEARRNAQEIVQSMRHETAEQADAIVRAAAEAALREKEERLARAAADLDAAVRFDASRVRALIEAVVRRVSGGR